MKVLLSVDTVRAPLTGIGRYVYELARHLPGEPNVSRVYQHDTVAGLLSPAALNRRADRQDASVIRKQRHRALRLALRTIERLTRQIPLPTVGSRLPVGPDLIAHGPAFALPPGNSRKVVTIADLSVIRYPQFHPQLRVKVVGSDIERALREADHLLTFSEFTRTELIDQLHCPPERVTAVPLAADASFTPRPAEAVQDTLQRYGLAWRGYCLSVGTIEPRKQIDCLLDAFVSQKPELQRHFPLALIGDPGWLSQATHERIDRLAATGRAHYLGYVPQEDLPLLYNGAAVCLYTSIYEGFGLPAVEAMASGVPLITTTAASLPEVCGDGAVLVPPNDADALSEALTAVLTEPEFAFDRVARGLAAARRFSWERTVTETVQVYCRVLAR